MNIMSFLNQSGALGQFNEVVPAAARMGGKLSRSSILTGRQTVQIKPQGPKDLGSAGTGGGNQTVSFLLTGNMGGLVDPRSIRISYFQEVAGGTGVVCPDDGHVFTTCQIAMGGQLIENIQHCAKVSVIEAKLGGSKSWYQSAGSFCGFELLNGELSDVVPTTTYATTMSGAWGYVPGVAQAIENRYTRTSNLLSQNNLRGAQRSIPLGLVSGVGRIEQYIPLGLFNDLTLTLQTGSAAEVLFNYSSSSAGDYSLQNVTLTYDVVVPHPDFMALLERTANDPNSEGISIPFESTTMAVGSKISASASALTNIDLVVTKSTTNLLRAHAVFIHNANIASLTYPSQSCFSHAGVAAYQWKIGSSVFPQLPAAGNAEMFLTSLAAYGSPVQENASVINRYLWGNSTDPSTAGTGAVFPDSECTTAKFAYADSFIPSMNFRTVVGDVVQSVMDGFNVSASSGSAVGLSLLAAPPAEYLPIIMMVSAKVLSSRGGAAQVIGA